MGWTEYISIHVPIAGNDAEVSGDADHATAFQSTFPLQGTTILRDPFLQFFIFQSTFPLQGTTLSATSSFTMFTFQSTFPLQGTTQTGADAMTQGAFQSTFPLQGTTPFEYVCKYFGIISIHVPIAGND